MLFIVGLGLDEKGISQRGLEAIRDCKKIYLENYTADFPYDLEDLKLNLELEITPLERSEVESNRLIQEAKTENIALLVYGSPLFATTHLALMKDAQEQGVKTEIVHSSSIFDAIAETGLQLYKFGKITSIPKFESDSFIQIVKDNKRINAHSLILIDIGLEFRDAIVRLETASKKQGIKIEKLVVCEKLGTKKSRIYYDKIENLKDKIGAVQSPFCFIIPGKLHFMEEEVLRNFKG